MLPSDEEHGKGSGFRIGCFWNGAVLVGVSEVGAVGGVGFDLGWNVEDDIWMDERRSCGSAREYIDLSIMMMMQVRWPDPVDMYA